MSGMPLKTFVAATALALFSPDVSADPLTLPLPSAKGTQASNAVSGFPALYQSKVIKNCPASTQCIAPFAPVPANRVLRATNINCFAEATGNAQVTFALITSLTEPFDYFVTKSENQFRSSINETILSFFEGGTRPRIFLGAVTSANLVLVCNLTGTLLTP